MKVTRVKFKDIVFQEKGFLRGPFGGDLKKEIFVPKDSTTYKVYEQGVVLQKDDSIGRYYISKEYFDKKMHKFETKAKDFLISCSGANYGAIYQLNKNAERGVINQALLRIRLNNELIDDDFFYYYFDFYLVNMIIGKKGDSTIPNFPPVSVIKELEFSLTDIYTQKKIGTFLKNIDSKIELNNKMNKELEAMAKTLYDYWFVQFDFPDVNGKPYKSSGGKMVYNQELKREIPDGWEVIMIKEIATIIMGQSPKSEFYNKNNEGLPLLNGAADYVNGVLFPDNYTTSYPRVCNKNDFVLCIRATIGNLVYAEREFCLGRGVAAVRVNDYQLSEQMYYVLLNEIEKFKKQATGSIIKGIIKDDLTNVKITIPNKYIKNKFHNLINPIFTKIRINKQQNQELSKLRDWLLPMLMNGQVKVK